MAQAKCSDHRVTFSQEVFLFSFLAQLSSHLHQLLKKIQGEMLAFLHKRKKSTELGERDSRERELLLFGTVSFFFSSVGLSPGAYFRGLPLPFFSEEGESPKEVRIDCFFFSVGVSPGAYFRGRPRAFFPGVREVSVMSIPFSVLCRFSSGSPRCDWRRW